MRGLYLDQPTMSELFRIDFDLCDKELERNREFLGRFGNGLPAELYGSACRPPPARTPDRDAFGS